MNTASGHPMHPGPSLEGYDADVIARARDIRLLAMDVDGVLTASEITYLSNGEEIKSYNVKDGHGLFMARSAGILTAIITGRQSPINERRAKELQIHYLFQGIKLKLPVLEQIMEEHQLTLSQVAYIGDDLPDLPILEVVGLACCPQDAVEEIKAVSHFVSRKEGGRGAVRELTDLLMKVRATQSPQNGLRTAHSD